MGETLDGRSSTHVVDEHHGKAGRVSRDGFPGDGLSARGPPVLPLSGRGDGDGLDGESKEGSDGEEFDEHHGGFGM